METKRGNLCTITDMFFRNRHRREMSFFLPRNRRHHLITAHHIALSISARTGTNHATWHEACTRIIGQLFLHEASNSPTNEWAKATHSGTRSKSEPCVQREQTGRDIMIMVMVIVAESASATSDQRRKRGKMRQQQEERER